jgi:hypothetical protein
MAVAVAAYLGAGGAGTFFGDGVVQHRGPDLAGAFFRREWFLGGPSQVSARVARSKMLAISFA